MGTELTIEEGLGITAVFGVTEQFEGGPGVIHGGVLSAAFDEAMGSTSIHLHTPVVTAHLEVDFVQPILLGSRLHVRARIVGSVGRKLYTSAEAFVDESESVVATSRALFLTIDPKEHFKDSAALSSRL